MCQNNIHFKRHILCIISQHYTLCQTLYIIGGIPPLFEQIPTQNSTSNSAVEFTLKSHILIKCHNCIKFFLQKTFLLYIMFKPYFRRGVSSSLLPEIYYSGAKYDVCGLICFNEFYFGYVEIKVLCNKVFLNHVRT